jgi:multiple sugar transport system substrate-binding protein
MKKHVNGFLVMLLLLSLLLAACSSKEDEDATEVPEEAPATPVPTQATEPTAPSGPVSITYFTFSAAPDHLEDLDQMIQSFQAAHPNVEVQVETAAWDDYFTSLQDMIDNGTPPDVFELNYENFVSFASKGALLDMDPLAAADKDFDQDIFYPRAYNAFNLDGQQLGLPATFSTVVLFYNKDMFDAAGLDYPAADWSWDDTVTAAAQLTDADAGVWGLYSPIQFWEFYKKAAQNRCEFFNADQTEVTVNAAPCVETLETMISFVNEHGVMPSDADLGDMSDGDLFASGKLGMLVSGIWMFAAFKDAPFAWDIQVEPGLQEQATHFFANTASVSAASQHPQEAWQWVKFFTSSPDMAQIRIDSGWELAALNNPHFFLDYLELGHPDNRDAVFESLEYSIVPPVIEHQNEMQDAVNALIEQAKLGQLSPQEALDQAKAEIEALLP